MIVEIGSSVPVEIAHRSVHGREHGHSLIVEAYRGPGADLDAWRAAIQDSLQGVEDALLEDGPVRGRSFEDLAVFVLTRLPAAIRVVVRLPTRGHVVEARR